MALVGGIALQLSIIVACGSLNAPLILPPLLTFRKVIARKSRFESSQSIASTKKKTMMASCPLPIEHLQYSHAQQNHSLSRTILHLTLQSRTSHRGPCCVLCLCYTSIPFHSFIIISSKKIRTSLLEQAMLQSLLEWPRLTWVAVSQQSILKPFANNSNNYTSHHRIPLAHACA